MLLDFQDTLDIVLVLHLNLGIEIQDVFENGTVRPGYTAGLRFQPSKHCNLGLCSESHDVIQNRIQSQTSGLTTVPI